MIIPVLAVMTAQTFDLKCSGSATITDLQRAKTLSPVHWSATYAVNLDLKLARMNGNQSNITITFDNKQIDLSPEASGLTAETTIVQRNDGAYSSARTDLSGGLLTEGVGKCVKAPFSGLVENKF